METVLSPMRLQPHRQRQRRVSGVREGDLGYELKSALWMIAEKMDDD